MALAPKFAAQKLSAAAASPNIHTLEIYLDYVCPYSAKIFKTVYESVFPVIKEKYADKVQIIFRQQIQPWHPSSTLVHEAALAVLRLSPTAFYPFSSALFAAQADYFDVSVVNEVRNDTYKRLAKLASSVGVNEAKFLDQVIVADKPAKDGSLNIGNKVTDDLKLLIKAARLTGVHVSPTVLLDGIVENSISSGWTKEQWEEFLENRIV